MLRAPPDGMSTMGDLGGFTGVSLFPYGEELTSLLLGGVILNTLFQRCDRVTHRWGPEIVVVPIITCTAELNCSSLLPILVKMGVCGALTELLNELINNNHL